ncbi:adenylate/guanylate cyclase domain-containing protein [Amorphus orientalis]|uniref:Adenylate cyclase n=1 Tax=Amorphus orientalis TaxID=649198 RepID=A0AAE3VKZ6_9HYPH|nr:adenylate/guanylate cyclase domain-containing protein [Amorphus orientalis]MDQ0314089.1 adenylate cyclase [Amorphus orientalis]
MTDQTPSSETSPAASRLAPEVIVDWLVEEAPRLEAGAFIDGLGWRLRRAGMPLDRMMISLRMISPNLLAAGFVWRPFQPIGYFTYDYADRDKGFYEHSPFKVVHDTGEWLELDVAQTPDERFGIIPDLKEEEIRHYLVVPLWFTVGPPNSLSFATKAPQGFSDADKALIKRILPALANVLEIKRLRRTLDELLATYVGTGPAAQIMDGVVHRGEVVRIDAAMMMADLRGFTALSTRLPVEETADLLNRYYDAVVPAIVAEGGEVLKFIGDAVLAIFPAEPVGAPDACARALRAAEAAMATEIEPVVVDGEPHTIQFGIGLHFGEAVYGNVGSGNRLDFTAVGRDVNVLARISQLCSVLQRPLLASESFVGGLGEADGAFASLGGHSARGLSDPLYVFEPAAEAATAIVTEPNPVAAVSGERKDPPPETVVFPAAAGSA